MFIKKFILSIPLILFIFSGCVTTPAVVVKGGYEDKIITAKPGSTFSVQLESQLSTGFSWKLAELPASVRIIKEDVLTGSKNITGGTDIQEFIFKTSEKGGITLTFNYGEHWKEKPKFVKTSKVKVIIE